MKDENRAREAMHEYSRLVAILNDERWRDEDPKFLEQRIGRPIVGRKAFNEYVAVQDAFDEAIVDVIAEALDAGVTQVALVASRGWLSHNDIRAYIDKARRPAESGYPPVWLQTKVLHAVRTDVATLALKEPDEALKLARAARTFLRRWVDQIPAQPSEDQLARVATMWRSEHVARWEKAREQLRSDVERLGVPKESV